MAAARRVAPVVEQVESDLGAVAEELPRRRRSTKWCHFGETDEHIAAFRPFHDDLLDQFSSSKSPPIPIARRGVDAVVRALMSAVQDGCLEMPLFEAGDVLGLRSFVYEAVPKWLTIAALHALRKKGLASGLTNSGGVTC